MIFLRTNALLSRGLGRATVLVLLSLLLGSCVAAVVGAAVDTTIEVAKVPFKVAGAVVDVAVPDGDDDED
jgi:hypothetical protein